MNIRCLIADDEPLALQLISDYISRIPHLKLVAKCKNAAAIPELLGQVDLIFLDIRMPGLSGLDLLRSLPSRPMVILITAYSEYALEGFEMDVIDYLVKPVSFERFFKAVNKATLRHQLNMRAFSGPIVKTEPEPKAEHGEKSYFFMKSGYKSVRINFDDILYIEGMKEYVSIFTAGGNKFVKLAALKDLEVVLPGEKFLRIHKSYIVAIHKVTAAYGNTIEISAISLPVGRSYKDAVMSVFS